MSIMDRSTNTDEIDDVIIMRGILAKARKKLYFTQFGRKDEFKARSGNTVRWYSASTLAAQTSTINDSPTLRNSEISFTPIEKTLSMYGNDLTYVEALDLTSVCDIPGQTREEMAYNAGLSIDTVVRDTLLASEDTSGIDHLFANDSTAVTIDANDIAKYDDIIDVATELEEAGVPRVEHPKSGLGVYIAIVTPRMKSKWLKDTNFRAAINLGQPEKAWYGELGIIDNVCFVISDNSADYTYNGVTCQKAFVTGKDSYGVAALPEYTGMSASAPAATVSQMDNEIWTADQVNRMFKLVLTPAGDGKGNGAHGDEYAVKTTIAWKAYFAHTLLVTAHAKVYVAAKGATLSAGSSSS